VRCINSFAVGESVRSLSSIGFGSGTGTTTPERSCVSISRVTLSCASARDDATATLCRGVSFGSTGSGVFARPVLFRVAAAVEIRLRQDVGLRGLRRRLGVHERDLQWRGVVGHPTGSEREVDHHRDGVQRDGHADRDADCRHAPNGCQRFGRDARGRQDPGKPQVSLPLRPRAQLPREASLGLLDAGLPRRRHHHAPGGQDVIAIRPDRGQLRLCDAL
jgi:hypothetical protein